MKTLAELRTEVEVGLIVYPSTNHDLAVWREEANEFHEIWHQRQTEHPWYKLYRSPQTPLEVECTDEEKEMERSRPNCDIEHAYPSFDALLADWPSLASQPVWNTAKSPERIAYEETEQQAREKQQWIEGMMALFGDETATDEDLSERQFPLPEKVERNRQLDKEPKFSTPCKLIDLEEVINTRTSVWDIAGSGDVRVKLDTDVNDQEWYVLSDDRNVDPLYGKVECWAFPHFNGAHDQYSYKPIAYCFKTFAELLAAHPTERAVWGYNVEEYEMRCGKAFP